MLSDSPTSEYRFSLRTCISDCQSDPECAQCYRAEINCVDACPCHAECPQGCLFCYHPICYSEECDEYEINNNYKTCLFDAQDILGSCNLDCYYGLTVR